MWPDLKPEDPSGATMGAGANPYLDSQILSDSENFVERDGPAQHGKAEIAAGLPRDGWSTGPWRPGLRGSLRRSAGFARGSS